MRTWTRLSLMGLSLWAAARASTLASAHLSPAAQPRTASYASRQNGNPSPIAGQRRGAETSPRAANAHAKLNEILNRSEFRENNEPSAADLWRARVNRWIFEHLIALLTRLHISEKTRNYFAWSVIYLALGALFFAVYRWLSKTAGPAELVAETEPMTSDARHWLAEALSAAERCDYREAIHCAYWAAVARLEDMRLLARDRARTPRESLRLLEEHPRERGFLQVVTRSFELIWYGYRPASQVEWAQTKEQLEKMGCLQGSIAPTAQS